ncbi:hypothetical protein ACP70R_014553 [Stipagrostis hirtigluma subsp. patula]
MAPPSELIDDVLAEILLRLPPDDPACLVRASLVCKPWRRVLSDPAFPRRYRAFHGAPPLLGFLRTSCTEKASYVPSFIPIAARSPLLQPAFHYPAGRTLDCRHGRVLLDKLGGEEGGMLAVWDPIAGDRKVLPMPRSRYYYSHNAAVLCAAAGCDHLDCHGGPFLVVFVGCDVNTGDAWVAWASVYSSEAGEWSSPASVHLAPESFFPRNRGALVGDELYFVLSPNTAILKYDLGSHCLSLMDSPYAYDKRVVLMAMEDGSLGLAGISGPNLYLWSRKVNPMGAAAWERFRAVSVQKSFRPSKGAKLIGFAENVGVLLVGTDACAFTFELSSGRVRKLSKPGWCYYGALPFMSFYTPDCANSKKPLSAETN